MIAAVVHGSRPLWAMLVVGALPFAVAAAMIGAAMLAGKRRAAYDLAGPIDEIAYERETGDSIEREEALR